MPLVHFHSRKKSRGAERRQTLVRIAAPCGLKWFWGASAKLSGIVPHPDGIIRLQGLRLAN